MRRFFAVKQSAMNGAPARRDLGSPLARVSAPRNAKKLRSASGVASPAVALIDRAAYVTQVLVSIVRPVAVYVVNLTSRPKTVDVEPRKPVCSVKRPAKTDVPISAGVDASGLFPVLAPYKLASPF